MENLEINSRSWTSGNEIIDDFIREIQLEINNPSEFKWVPYNQFSKIKKIGNCDFVVATWKHNQSDVTVNLKYLYNSQNVTTHELRDEIRRYSIRGFGIIFDNICEIYGISQNPDTKDYILVLQDGYCKGCGENGNEKIDEFIQEMQLKVNDPSGIIFKWISYDRLSDIKKIGNKIYLALWKGDQLEYNRNKKEWTRVKVEINLKLFNSQNTIDGFLNKIVEYKNDDNFKIYGISQNPDTKDYMLALQTGYLCEECGEKYSKTWYKWCKPCQIKNLRENFKNWTSRNEKIDNFIQEMQLKIKYPYDTIFEWISYNQFSDIKEISNTIYSALWNDGQLKYDREKKEWTRVQVEINLKLFNSQNTIDEFLNKVIEYKNDDFKIYGISQNPDTKDYMLVLQTGCHCKECFEKYLLAWCKWCEPCQIKNLRENFKNWTSGNEKIDNFIQEMQLKVNRPYDIVSEWILYDQFSDIKVISNTIYSALWNDGQLKYDLNKKEWTRVQVEISLKLFNSQNTIDEFLNKVIEYKNDDNVKIYGISQNPDTKDYILILQTGCNCEECGEKYTEISYKWCKPCQIKNLRENFKNWTSGNEKIDNFIQKMQLKVNRPYDIVFEWILYDQFSDIKEINNTIYSALWNDGQLKYGRNKKEWTRVQVEINLKLFNSQNTIDEFLNKVAEYKNDDNVKIYGISQNLDTKDYILIFQTGCNCEGCGEKYTEISYKWCKPCQIKNLRENFKDWTSGNEKIDNFIQEMQLKVNRPYDTVFEWISYDQFSDIKEISNTIYSALWNDGQLKYDLNKKEWTRIQVEINLKLCNSQNTIDEFLNKVKVCKSEMYGISQNPDTKDYILVFQCGYCCRECGEKYTEIWDKWCKSCQIKNLKETFIKWTSGNEKIDNFIQEMQLKINHSYDIIFEWIPYNQFSSIKKISNSIYSALWRAGPLKCNHNKKEWTRIKIEVNLKLYNLQNTIDEFLNKVRVYESDKNFEIYGISQNPDTRDYILIHEDGHCRCGEMYTDIRYKWCKPCQIKNLKENFGNWTSEDEKIDNFIQEMQLKINNPKDIIFEWISYYRFSDVKKISNAVYSALWKDGPLKYNQNKQEWKRIQFKEVILKLCNSQYMADEFLNKIKVYENDKIFEIYGISQDSDTNDYIIVLQKKNDKRYCRKCIEKYTEIEYKWCKLCQIKYLKENFKNWTSKNEIIDNFIQEMQLKVNNPKDLVFEWISYDQFNDIKEINKTVYSALWKDGPLKYNLSKKKWARVQAKGVTLKLCDSKNTINNFLNKIIVYKSDENFEIYGISQNPDTRDYVLVSQDGYCEECDEKYTEIQNKWCKSCQIKNLKVNFGDWTSGNEKIDNFIQEMQLKVNHSCDIIFEWISYDQFSSIKEVNNTIYSALWNDGPLEYESNKKKWVRVQAKEVTLKLCNSKNMINGFLNKVEIYNNYFKIHGIAQKPDSEDYVMVLKNYHKGYVGSYCEICIEEYTDIKCKWCKSCQIDYLRKNFTNWSGNEKIDEFIQEMQLKINNPNVIVFEWIPYNQFKAIKKIGKGGFATVYSAKWKNGPLHYDKEWKRGPYKKVALKLLNKSHDIIDEILKEIKAYSMNKCGSNIVKIYGISQDPKTKNYIIVLQYAEGGNFSDWINKCYKHFDWNNKLRTLYNIIIGLNEIHRKQMVHRDFHTGNILFEYEYVNRYNDTYISDMGLCGEIGNVDKSKIYGVMPYVAPEVLRGKSYTKAADIYSFGMIMYFVATGRQPFSDHAHDKVLALGICNGIRPKLNELEAPKCYVELMERCWDSVPDNRPNAIEIENIIYSYNFGLNSEIKKQFKEAEEYRKVNISSISSIEINQSTTHPQASNISQLLNPFTKDLPKCDNNDDHSYSDCLDCVIDD
ncbi:unnamed protein product [Rhizophagus irregularis]|nr:unnamed protein product [Rhizophagus irregularis]